MSSTTSNAKGREKDIVIQQLKDEVLIYDLKINKAYCLNESSTLVWNLCDGSNSIADISRKLSQKLKQPVTDDFIWLALDQFKKDNLLSKSEELIIKFDGLSRREVIRKVGFASMIALPVISSLIAPNAAHAQSRLASGSDCTSGAQCTSGTCTGTCSTGGTCSSFTCVSPQGTCSGTGTCSTGGSCTNDGLACSGIGGTGTCFFSGFCTNSGSTCHIQGFPCSGQFGTCDNRSCV